MRNSHDYEAMATQLDAEVGPVFHALESVLKAGAEWPDPAPLPDTLPPVAPFDPELLPEALRG